MHQQESAETRETKAHTAKIRNSYKFYIILFTTTFHLYLCTCICVLRERSACSSQSQIICMRMCCMRLRV